MEDRNAADGGYDQKVAASIADVRHHLEEEEGEVFPKLRSALSADQLDDIGQKLADGKAKAPTHPTRPTPPAALGQAGRPRPPARSTGSLTS